MSTIYWIKLTWNNDTLCAKIDGRKAERYWNKQKLQDKELRQEYTYSQIVSIHPNEITQGIFQAVGFDAMNIKNFKVIPGDKTIEEILNAW